MPNPTVVSSPSTLRDHVGSPLGPSDWLVVTQEMIDDFAHATGDRQWIHVDPGRAARESPFGSTVAHGFLTLALVPRLLDEILLVEQTALTVNAGLRRVKLSAPVPSEGRIRLHGEITDARSLSGGAVRAAISLKVELSGSARPACVAEIHFVYTPEG